MNYIVVVNTLYECLVDLIGSLSMYDQSQTLFGDCTALRAWHIPQCGKLSRPDIHASTHVHSLQSGS